MNGMNTYVVIPAFNAEQKIREVVLGLLNRGFSVVVVDDGSEDQTYCEAKKSRAIVLRHLVNRGQGASLATGVMFALRNRADVIIHFDADGQHRAEDAEKMTERLLRSDVDVVLGSRVLGGMHFGWVDKIKLHGKRFVDRVFTGITLTDVHSGLRVMNRRAAELVQITHDRMAHATEIVSEIRRHSLRYVEFPIVTLYTEYSRAHSANRDFVKASARILRDLVVGKVVK